MQQRGRLIATSLGALVTTASCRGDAAPGAASVASGAVWVNEWNSGQLSRYDPATGLWTTWPLPGHAPQSYAVYVDRTGTVGVSDAGGNALRRFDPVTGTIFTFEMPSNPGNVHRLLGRPGDVWGAESAADQLVVIRRRNS